MRMVLTMILLLFFGMGGVSESFAEKTISIQDTVHANKDSLTGLITSLDLYSQIFPDHIKSSQLIKNNTANMKIGLDWLTTSMDVTAKESGDMVTLEVMSGVLKEQVKG